MGHRAQRRHRLPRAPDRVTNAFIDLILASRGRVVTISRVSGTLSSALMGAYSMSKHAVEAYTDALVAQMEPQGIHGVAVAPGNDDSRIVADAAGRVDPPADATPEVRALFEDPEAQDRSAFPPPDDVAEACHAAPFDEAPFECSLVVPVAHEVHQCQNDRARA